MTLKMSTCVVPCFMSTCAMLEKDKDKVLRNSQVAISKMVICVTPYLDVCATSNFTGRYLCNT